MNRLGLYHDGFVTSTAWLDPLSTAPAIIGLVLLLGYAIYRLRSGSIWAFAVVFFFVGHALESSFFPLEMVYEHRNYVPSFAFAMLFAHLVFSVVGRSTRPVALAGLVAVVVLSTSSVVTWARVGFWSSESLLAKYLAEQHPDSYRAQSFVALVTMKEGGSVAGIFAAFRHVAKTNPSSVFALIRMRSFSHGDAVPS